MRSDEALDDSKNGDRGAGNGRRFPTQVPGGPSLPGGSSTLIRFKGSFLSPHFCGHTQRPFLSTPAAPGRQLLPGSDLGSENSKD